MQKSQGRQSPLTLLSQPSYPQALTTLRGQHLGYSIPISQGEHYPTPISTVELPMSSNSPQYPPYYYNYDIRHTKTNTIMIQYR